MRDENTTTITVQRKCDCAECKRGSPLWRCERPETVEAVYDAPCMEADCAPEPDSVVFVMRAHPGCLYWYACANDPAMKALVARASQKQNAARSRTNGG